ERELPARRSLRRSGPRWGCASAGWERWRCAEASGGETFRKDALQIDLEPAVSAGHPVDLKGMDAAPAGTARELEELSAVATEGHESVARAVEEVRAGVDVAAGAFFAGEEEHGDAVVGIVEVDEP